MDNKEIAERLARIVYSQEIHNSDYDKEFFAIQLFVEKILVPEDIEGYTKNQLEEYILNYLNSK